MSRVLVLAVGIFALAGCGGASNKGTKLTMVAVNTNVGRAAFHLSCNPAGGDFPNPEAACAVLADRPQLVTRPQPFVCHGGLFSWWDVTITGQVRGRNLRRSFSTCWTTQSATLGRLGMTVGVLHRHLAQGLRPGHGSVAHRVGDTAARHDEHLARTQWEGEIRRRAREAPRERFANLSAATLRERLREAADDHSFDVVSLKLLDRGSSRRRSSSARRTTSAWRTHCRGSCASSTRIRAASIRVAGATKASSSRRGMTGVCRSSLSSTSGAVSTKAAGSGHTVRRSIRSCMGRGGSSDYPGPCE
jgi:hypothetical protein